MKVRAKVFHGYKTPRGILMVIEMFCVLSASINIQIVIYYLWFYKMFPLGKPGWRVHRISLYYFSEMHVSCNYLLIKFSFKKLHWLHSKYSCTPNTFKAVHTGMQSLQWTDPVPPPSSLRCAIRAVMGRKVNLFRGVFPSVLVPPKNHLLFRTRIFCFIFV